MSLYSAASMLPRRVLLYLKIGGRSHVFALRFRSNHWCPGALMP